MTTSVSIVGYLECSGVRTLFAPEGALVKSINVARARPGTNERNALYCPVALTFTERQQPSRMAQFMASAHAFLETVGDVAGKLAKTPATTLVQAALLLAAKVTEKSTPLAAEVKAAKPQDGIHDSFIALYRELQVQGKLPKDFPAIERKDVDSLFDHLKQIPSSSRPNESPALVTQLTGWLEVDTKEHASNFRFTLKGNTHNDIANGESELSAEARFDVFGPDGSLLLTIKVPKADLLDTWLAEGVEPHVKDDTHSDLAAILPDFVRHTREQGRSRLVRGRVWLSDGSSVGGRTLAIFAPPSTSHLIDPRCAGKVVPPMTLCCNADDEEVLLAPVALAVTETDDNGYFEFVYRDDGTTSLSHYVLVRVSGFRTAIAVQLMPAGSGFAFPPSLLVQIERSLIADELADDRAIQWVDPGDANCDKCSVNRFDVPNRAIDEFAVNFVIRTTEPQIQMSTLGQPNGNLAPDQLFRSPLSGDRRIEWDEPATVSQATTIAHGRVLTVKQVWRADGYSLGDLLYSLPLAPLQKKNIAVYEWNKRTDGQRAESQAHQDALDNDVRHDRDISEIVHTAISESIRARSESGSRSGSSGGGFLGAVFGGGSSGSANAWSTSSQDSARDLSGRLLSSLRDRTVQAATAFRAMSATVVAQQSDSESARVMTETVTNRNACHAMTVQYFEVLRHFKVDYELSSVRECLFVPLRIEPFSRRKILRWASALRTFATHKDVGTWIDGCERLQADAVLTDEERKRGLSLYPPGRNADEIVESLEGDLTITLEFPSPAALTAGEKYDGSTPPAEYMVGGGAWLGVLWHIFGGIAREKREAYFETSFAPLLARKLVADLQLELELKGDGRTYPYDATFTLLTPYSRGARHRVSVRRSSANALNVSRADIVAVRLKTKTTPLPLSAVAIVNEINLSYATRLFDSTLVANAHVDDSIRKTGLANDASDDVVVRTRLDAFERQNPRQADIDGEKRLYRHLDEFLEYYHKGIWWTMDPDRRYGLLDGIIAPNSGGRSVASVVENRLLGIVGNSLVMPVATGTRLDYFDESSLAPHADRPAGSAGDADGDPLLAYYRPLLANPSVRISVPTRGVFAEAMTGNCNSCETVDDRRNWRYWEHPLPDEPTAIAPITFNPPAAGNADTKPTSLPTSTITQVQTSVNPAPAPADLTAILAAVAAANAFRSETGLAGTQQNAHDALQQSYESTNKFGELTAGLLGKAADAVAAYYTGGASVAAKAAIGKDAAAGRITKAQAQQSIAKVNDAVTDNLFSTPAKSLLENRDVSAVVSAAALGGAPVSVSKGDARIDVGAPTLRRNPGAGSQPSSRLPWPFRLFSSEANATQPSSTRSLDFDQLWQIRQSLSKREPKDYFAPATIADLDIHNLCAVKMSDALGQVMNIDGAYQVSSARGFGGRRYVLSAEKFAGWLRTGTPLGSADIQRKGELSGYFTRLKARGARGVIFLKDYWGDPRIGDHIDLWNGATHSAPIPDDMPAYLATLERDCQEIWFWEIDRGGRGVR